MSVHALFRLVVKFESCSDLGFKLFMRQFSRFFWKEYYYFRYSVLEEINFNLNFLR